ncbi:lytic transglycosylase domain-containing protein [Quadrisphaera sp. DSM 44207]|uniref:lytic transglycosylase domain-containing protein n=1 Tax=Quadrisphaera sp. DSM 44207 TaxID=1881057 RepID=UPI00087F8566|nr:lytic transglycosylase domain-containing protein [Quadrisphaera sp. DSM 44207]SDQ20027.1 Transglycosylase SLT domain-containing protein [Quadrisphaera sp. DSM 44207]
MIAVPEGLGDVQARVQALQARLAALGGTAPARAAVGASALTASSGAAFEQVLAQAAEEPASGAAAASGTASWARPAALRTAGASGASGVDGASPYASLFAAATERYHLPAGLLGAVAQVESGGRADAVSPAGAQGLMQIMPGTASELGVDPMVPAQAVDGAARLLARHLDSFGSVPLALAAYNAGPGAVRRHDGVPPYAETQAYVRKVTDLMSRSTA